MAAATADGAGFRASRQAFTPGMRLTYDITSGLFVREADEKSGWGAAPG